MPKLVLVRHGESQYNLENRFTGWLDVPLTEKGIQEAKAAAERLKKNNLHFQKAYSSDLSRSRDSLTYILKALDQENIPIEINDALNERHYGELQGLDKTETAKKFGDEKVKIWRRSYHVAPPGGESLEQCAARVLPYLHSKIMEDIRLGKNVLVVAHGNSLRAIVMDVQKLTKDEIVQIEIPTGVPILYEFDKDLKLISKIKLET